MNDKDRRLIRQFYQSIPTAEEKAAFYAVMGASKEERIRYAAQMLGKSDLMTPELIDAITTAATLTKEDRILIFSGIVRKLIFKLLGF
jgi:hypothetical protein